MLWESGLSGRGREESFPRGALGEEEGMTLALPSLQSMAWHVMIWQGIPVEAAMFMLKPLSKFQQPPSNRQSRYYR